MSIQKKLIIAVDGFSSCGKSTFAKAIAQKLGYIYIDTGSMYRAVTLFAINSSIIKEGKLSTELLKKSLEKINIDFRKNKINFKDEICLNGENVEDKIRGMEVSELVSSISSLKEVRAKMVELQREMSKEKGVVLDGRDIGTVVFPNADIKIFMTADPDVRAQRRFDELAAKGEKVSFDEIKLNIMKRDELDTTRVESPLIKADDAVVLDNSYMNPEEQMEWFFKTFKFEKHM
jgi:cytidylate kinase